MKTCRRAKTIAAIVTPIGEGGIGVVQILGPDAVAIVERIFRPTRPRRLPSVEEGRLCHGFIHDRNGPIDEVILRVCPQARLAEINCHGGIAAVRKIHDLVLRSGAVGAPPEDLLVETMGRGLDETRREAIRRLPQAATRLAAAMLLGQCAGALSRRLAELLRAPAAGDLLAGLEALLRTADYGIGLCVPRKIVVVGKPNVGKSTLVNALLREDRVLVHHLPGTTRDAIAEMADLRGVPFELVDTAGIRQARDEIEALGVAESRRQIGAADILLLVLDLAAPLGPEDRDLLALTAHRNVIVAANKADRPPAWGADEIAGTPVLRLSALDGRGLEQIEDEIAARCGVGAYRPEEPIVFTQRQRGLLESACEALREGRCAEAEGRVAACLGSA